MVRYTLTIFISAFLLFLIQPLVARRILPIYGGTAAVWTTCLVYFQLVLLLGYLYAHLLRTGLSPRTGFTLHATLLIAACVCGMFSDVATPSLQGDVGLAASVAFRLTVAIGLPLLVLAATGPLVQAWHSLTHPQRATYRLYALSNVGSLMALLGYPFVFERVLGLNDQTTVWWSAYLLFAVLMLASGWQVRLARSWPDHCPGDEESEVQPHSPGPLAYLCWTALAASACALLVSVTHLLCQELTAFPFLWILPLTAYLLTLIICFDRPAWYRRMAMLSLWAVSVAGAMLLYHLGNNAGLLLHAIVSVAVVFTGCMVCHGELALARPATRYLTLFYLLIAVGGVTGGLFAAVVAPRIFTEMLEFHVSILACLVAATLMLVWQTIRAPSVSTTRLFLWLAMACAAATPVICSLWMLQENARTQATVFQSRNDYGIVSVRDGQDYRFMFNGRTNHGGQYLSGNRLRPSGYYSSGSGADVAFRAIRKWKADQAQESTLKIGVVGLGTGSLASYATAGDQFRFYEINPLALRAARDYFTFLDHCRGDVLVGDGRLLLEQEAATGNANGFDLLFVDAFSSDSIPVHLLTTECAELYLSHLQQEGILIFHITNRFVDLRAVMKNLAVAMGLAAVIVEHEDETFGIRTRWVLMAPTASVLEQPIVHDRRQPWPVEMPTVLWTDDYSSLAPVVIWSGRLNLLTRPPSRSAAN